MTFEQFVTNWALTVDTAVKNGLRQGQYALNLLTTVRPDLAQQVMGDIDPFNSNDRLPAFWNWLGDNWDSSPAPVSHNVFQQHRVDL